MTHDAGLIPPDVEQCQVEITKPSSFMTFGPRPRASRCENPAFAVVRETKPGADGAMGSMSMCADCLYQFERQHFGEDGWLVQRIRREYAATVSVAVVAFSEQDARDALQPYVDAMGVTGVKIVGVKLVKSVYGDTEVTKNDNCN